MGYNHILVLHTDNGSFHKTKYVIDIVLALKESGYKVYFMTTTCTIKFINDVPIRIILAWFPRTIFGYCRREMTILRSVILAIYACWYPPKREPTYVICDGSMLAIPILKKYGFHVTYINYMVSFYHLMTKLTDYRMTPFQILLLKKADEVIVPTNQCSMCLNQYNVENETVIMPSCDRNLHAYTPCLTMPIPSLKSIPFLFTVFGEYNKQSNFEMVIDAFQNLKPMLDNEKLFSKTRLIFVGRCETIEEKEEFDNLCAMVNNTEKDIAEKIFFSDVKDFRKIKTFLRNSLALLDVTENTLFNLMVIRAQAMGTPTISFNTGFQREIIKPEITGVFIAKRAFAIRNCLHRFIKSSEWAKQIGKAARSDLRQRFSTTIFRNNLNNLVKGNVSRYNIYMPTDNVTRCSSRSSASIITVMSSTQTGNITL